MTTPPPTQQQSSTATYNRAIETLENAQTRLTSIRHEVSTSKQSLAVSYQGPDGAAFQSVMNQWLNGEEFIRGKCQQLINSLESSMGTSSKAQGAAQEAVASQTHLSVYNTMVP
ncbi:hypothetical protein ACWD04_31735 [Streptomyces sp. NPDC002911]